MSNTESTAAELRDAIRVLLQRPLLRAGGADGPVAATLRKPGNREQLQNWFDKNLGWRVTVDRDVIRLHKIPASSALLESDAPSQRCCVVYCLTLAALEDCGEQTVISELAERVIAYSSTRPEITTFDATLFHDRKALVGAVRLLTEHGALVPTRDRDSTYQDEQSYLKNEGNALYDVEHRAAAQLLACPTPPSRANGPHDLLREAVPDTVDGNNRYRRHQLMRRLVDDAVLYFDEISVDQHEYFRGQRALLVRELQDMLDVQVEIRTEGAAIVDDELTDLTFPRDTTSQYAALLLATALANEPKAGPDSEVIVTGDRLQQLSHDLSAQLTGKVKNIAGNPITPKSVLEVALRILIGLKLVKPLGDGALIRPALGRFRDRIQSGQGASHVDFI